MNELVSTEDRIETYLTQTTNTYSVGAPNYYARLALEQALIAHKEGNYGIGAVGIVVNEAEVQEFPARNAMFSGLGIVDHAETRALLAIKSGAEPSKSYSRETNEHTRELPLGISVYGTLEPCMMCDVALTNAGAKRSVSTVLDGELVQDGPNRVSDGGAMVLGEKGLYKPKVWQYIQAAIGIEYQLLANDDKDLHELSAKIFEDYREAVDKHLAERGING